VLPKNERPLGRAARLLARAAASAQGSCLGWPSRDTTRPLNPKRAAKKSAPAVLSEPRDVREAILTASRELIEAEGLSTLSMREVARRAGVSHQAPYNHFADREAILGALVEEGFDNLFQRLDAVRTSGSVDPVQLARACFSAYLEFACSHPAYFRLMFRPELVDLDRCEGAKEASERAFQCVRTIVHDMVLLGVPALPSEDALITLLWSTSHGLACLLLDGPLAKKLPHIEGKVLVEQVTTAFAGMIAAGLQTAKPSARKPARK
jgi:AcrR family transcriptional regulator